MPNQAELLHHNPAAVMKSAIILFLLSAVLLSAADPKQMLAERAASAAPAGTPEVYKIIWAARYYDADELARRQAALPYKTISIDRSGCYGTCPAYSVIFHRDGSAEKDARAYLPRLGHFVGKIRVTSFARICYALDRLGFFQLKPDYTANWTDDATCTITVDGQDKKRVSDYGQLSPIELWAIQMTIDQVAREEIDWEPAPNSPSPTTEPASPSRGGSS